MLSLLTFPHPARRSDAATLAANDKGQSGLWAYGISGDYPILLLRMADEAHGDLLAGSCCWLIAIGGAAAC